MKYLSLFFIGILFVTLFPLQSFANDDILFLRAKVLRNTRRRTGEFGNYQKLRLELLIPIMGKSSRDRNPGEMFFFFFLSNLPLSNFLQENSSSFKMGDNLYFLNDIDFQLFFVTLCFSPFKLFFSQKKGFYTFGLVVSFLVILFILIPLSKNGTSPLLCWNFSLHSLLQYFSF